MAEQSALQVPQASVNHHHTLRGSSVAIATVAPVPARAVHAYHRRRYNRRRKLPLDYTVTASRRGRNDSTHHWSASHSPHHRHDGEPDRLGIHERRTPLSPTSAPIMIHQSAIVPALPEISEDSPSHAQA